MKEEVDMSRLPKHIAIIMDGNRRWAKEKGLDPKLGHKQGAETLENIVKFANKLGIKYLTVYAFSTENWKRTEEEVGALMLLLQNYIEDFLKRVDTDNVKIKILGDITRLPKGLQKSIEKCIEKTQNNTGIVFNIAFNYGGRDEIVKAVQKIAKKVKDGEIDINQIEEKTVENELYTAGQPDPDLLIRTSGEMRTSNFLPWQLVYSEFLFMQKYWPDFTGDDLLEAISVYQKRNRKFGGK